MQENNSSRLDLLFVLYELGRKIKHFAKKGNKDIVLELIILRLVRNGCLDVTDLAKSISANLSSVSESAEKLVKAGYLIKEQQKNDKRRLVLCLSSEGSEFLSKTETLMKSTCITGFQNLTNKEIDQLLILLNKIDIKIN